MTDGSMRQPASPAGLELRRTGEAVELAARDPELEAAFEAALREAFHRRDLATIAAPVAHDLRAPINTMAVQLAVMEEAMAARAEGEAGAKERRRVALLQAELARLGRQLEALLGQLAGEEPAAREVDLGHLAGELALLLTAAGRKRQISVRPPAGADPAPIVAHPSRLRQALLRLGLLALARVPPGGELLLALAGDDDGGRLTIEAAGPGGETIPPSGPGDGTLELLAPAGFVAPLRSARALLVGEGARLALLPGGFSIDFLLSKRAAG